MIDPTANDIGRKVRFTPIGYEPGLTGKIVSFDDRLVFVQWDAGDGQPFPSHRMDLSWVPPDGPAVPGDGE